MIFVYNILVYMFCLLFAPAALLMYGFSKKRRVTIPARLGFQKKADKRKEKKRLWIQALSVGEVKSSVPFVKAFADKYPDWDIFFTASTKTGVETADEIFGKPGNQTVKQVLYFPFDIGLSIKRLIRRIDPDAVIIVETDVWPNFMVEIRQHRVPVLMINARLSQRSLKRYKWIRSFSCGLFSMFTRIMVQSSLDEKRFVDLGIDPANLAAAGNLKFDQSMEQADSAWTEQIKKQLGIGEKTIVLLAGSTHEGEENILLQVYNTLKLQFPFFLMIIAPRNPERCAAVRSGYDSAGVSARLMSQAPFSEDSGVVLVDSMGILSKLYVVCDAAFIGGSLVPEGGHNPLEAAAVSKPILFGPDMSDFKEMAALLTENGGAVIINSALEMIQELEKVFKDRSLQMKMGRKNKAVFAQNRGAADRIIQTMESLSIV